MLCKLKNEVEFQLSTGKFKSGNCAVKNYLSRIFFIMSLTAERVLLSRSINFST